MCIYLGTKKVVCTLTVRSHTWESSESEEDFTLWECPNEWWHHALMEKLQKVLWVSHILFFGRSHPVFKLEMSRWSCLRQGVERDDLLRFLPAWLLYSSLWFSEACFHSPALQCSWFPADHKNSGVHIFHSILELQRNCESGNKMQQIQQLLKHNKPGVNLESQGACACAGRLLQCVQIRNGNASVPLLS